MTISLLEIENIKGIAAKSFGLNIFPNKPSLLVAPNGFGKSSIAAAFICLNRNRLKVEDEHCHKGDVNLLPKLILEFTDDNSIHRLEASSDNNTISDHFDWYVINSGLRAKGIRRNFAGRMNVQASITIPPIVLVNTIPNRVDTPYRYTNIKNEFGQNGKVLNNITKYFKDRPFLAQLRKNNYALLEQADRVNVFTLVQRVKDEINQQNGTAAQLSEWLNNNLLGELEGKVALKQLADFIADSNVSENSRVHEFLGAIQLLEIFKNDKPLFKNFCKYAEYELDKGHYDETLQALNTSWCSIRPKKKSGKLTVEFPKATQISNGQRDVISFVTQLFDAERKLKKDNSILIIDEVFDYLDDANLIAVQYFITQFIKRFKASGKKIYPLILTHLNPYYFKNFAFSNQKVYFLDKSAIQPNPSMVRLLRKRNEPAIADDVSKYLLHFHCDEINARIEFRNLQLKETWGEGNNFAQFVEQETVKYLNSQDDYDPFAVCCYVRRCVEEYIYNQLVGQPHRQEFLNIHMTRKKLERAQKIGVEVPEYFYLLGIIYNDGMHWREGQDNVSPIAAKLANSTIKNLVREVQDKRNAA